MDELPDLRSWFDEDELRVCPSCGGRTLVPRSGDTDAGLEVCLSCGIVDTRRTSGGGRRTPPSAGSPD